MRQGLLLIHCGGISRKELGTGVSVWMMKVNEERKQEQVKRTRVFEPDREDDVEDTQKDSKSSNDPSSNATAEGEHTNEDEIEASATILVQQSKPLEGSFMPLGGVGNDGSNQYQTQHTGNGQGEGQKAESTQSGSEVACLPSTGLQVRSRGRT